MGRRAGPTRIEWHHGQYWCKFTVQGERKRLPTGVRDQGAVAEAEAEAERIRAKHTLGRPVERPTTRRRAAGNLEDLFIKHIAWAQAQGKAAGYIRKKREQSIQFCELWDDVADIDEAGIAKWQTKRSREIGSVTLYKEEVTLSTFLAWACKVAKVIQVIPRFDHCKPVSDYQPIDLDRHQVDQLLAALPDRRTHRKRCPVREFYTVQWALALRIGEVQAMRWNWIDFRERSDCPLGVITLPAIWQKNRQTWVEALPRAAYDVLQEMKRERDPLPTSLVFGRRDFGESLRVAALKCKLGDVVSHHLRHGRITEVANNTRDVASVQHVGRHKTLAMTQRYVRTRLEGAARAVFATDAAAERDRDRDR